jgi:hypothetical protein
MLLRRQFQQKARLQRTVDDESWIAFRFDGVGTVIMYPMRVERYRRVAKQPDGVDEDRPYCPTFRRGIRAVTRDRGTAIPRDGRRAIDDLLILLDGKTAIGRYLVFDTYKTQLAATSVLNGNVSNPGMSLDPVADPKPVQYVQRTARPHAARQWYGREEATTP